MNIRKKIIGPLIKYYLINILDNIILMKKTKIIKKPIKKLTGRTKQKQKQSVNVNVHIDQSKRTTQRKKEPTIGPSTTLRHGENSLKINPSPIMIQPPQNTVYGQTYGMQPVQNTSDTMLKAIQNELTSLNHNNNYSHQQKNMLTYNPEFNAIADSIEQRKQKDADNNKLIDRMSNVLIEEIDDDEDVDNDDDNNNIPTSSIKDEETPKKTLLGSFFKSSPGEKTNYNAVNNDEPINKIKTILENPKYELTTEDNEMFRTFEILDDKTLTQKLKGLNQGALQKYAYSLGIKTTKQKSRGGDYRNIPKETLIQLIVLGKMKSKPPELSSLEVVKKTKRKGKDI